MTTHYVFPEKSLTREHLPNDGYLVVYATVDVRTTEGDQWGLADRSGWVSTLDRRDEPEQARNDVHPLFSEKLPVRDEEWDDLKDIIKDMGPVDTEDGSTITATDPKVFDLKTDEAWQYTIHAHVKTYDTGTMNWVEVDARLL